MKVVSKTRNVITHVFLGLGSVIMLYPLVFAFLGMFVSAESFYEVGILPLPEGFSYFIDNITKIFRQDGLVDALLITIGRFVWYTVILSLTSILAGYAFAKIDFKGKNIAFYLLMSSMMIPGVALLVPQYLMLSRFPLVGGNNIMGVGGTGFRDSVLILFITGCFSAYNIFLVRQSLVGIGNEYKEAAEVDGAGFFRIVFSVYTPMLKPVIAVIIIQTFIGQWNDYLFPLIFAAKEFYPIGVWSTKVIDSYGPGASGGLKNYPIVMTMGVIMMIPTVAVYIAFQDYFVQGLTVGGVKS